MKVTIITGLLEGLEDLEVGDRVETIQTTELLKTARILRRVLEIWGDLLSLNLQWNTISKTNVKNSQGVNNDKQKKRTCRIEDFEVPKDHRVNLKQNWQCYYGDRTSDKLDSTVNLTTYSHTHTHTHTHIYIYIYIYKLNTHTRIYIYIYKLNWKKNVFKMFFLNQRASPLGEMAKVLDFDLKVSEIKFPSYNYVHSQIIIMINTCRNATNSFVNIEYQTAKFSVQYLANTNVLGNIIQRLTYKNILKDKT